MGRNEPLQDEPPLGLRVRELREAAGLSRDQLALRAGTTSETLLQIEMHGREPRYWTAWRIAKVLGVSMDELAGATPKAESVVVEVFPRRSASSSRHSSAASGERVNANWANAQERKVASKNDNSKEADGSSPWYVLLLSDLEEPSAAAA